MCVLRGESQKGYYLEKKIAGKKKIFGIKCFFYCLENSMSEATRSASHCIAYSPASHCIAQIAVRVCRGRTRDGLAWD